jgi:hypothetical protein
MDVRVESTQLVNKNKSKNMDVDMDNGNDNSVSVCLEAILGQGKKVVRVSFGLLLGIGNMNMINDGHVLVDVVRCVVDDDKSKDECEKALQRDVRRVMRAAMGHGQVERVCAGLAAV